MEQNSQCCERLLPQKRPLRLSHHEGLLSEIYCLSGTEPVGQQRPEAV